MTCVGALQAREEVDDYVYDDDAGFTPHYVPTVVRPWSSTSRGFDSGAPVIATVADFEVTIDKQWQVVR